MLAKINLGAVAKFAVLFGFTYVLLIIPWPGFDRLYSEYFRAFGATIFSRNEGPEVVGFAASQSPEAPNLDTQVTLGNRGSAESMASSVQAKTNLDSRSIGWIPTALTVALIVATPISLRRRAWALAGGLVLVHLFIILTLQSWIWNNAPTVGLMTMSDFGKQVTDALSYCLVNQLGASFSIPVLIWIVVTFRRQDLHSPAVT